ncbi:MAG: LLM class flavin-dependent oxidoreductase, partial [Acidimicrobiia bacterium]
MSEPTTPTASRDDVTFGVYLPQLAFDYSAMLDRALTIEALGIDQLWLFDHLYGPGLPGVDALEGWTLATALLARTERLRVGHLVLCTNFRHPGLTAKMIAAADLISSGRLEVGLGSGSYEQEHHEAGLPWGSFAERSERLAESLQIITQMLDTGMGNFTGKHFTVKDLPCLPRPYVNGDRTRPRIHIGGFGPRHTMPLVARFADVWNLPTYATTRAVETAARLDELCAEIGRDRASIRRSQQAVLVLVESESEIAAATEMAERRYKGPGFSVREGGYIGTPDMIVNR